jgi:hypothetical protein
MVTLENLRADEQPQAQMYGQKFSRECCFGQPSDSSCFLVIELF